MRLTIGRKLGLGFGIPLVLLALIGIAVFIGFNTLTNAARDSIEAQQTIEFMERGMKLLLTERILLSHQFATGEETTAAETRDDYMQEWALVVENTSARYSDMVMEIQRAVTIYHQYLDKAQSSVFSALTIRRGLTNAALYLSSAAESISRGDLDTPIIAETGDEMEDLARSIERMRVSLKAAIERLRRRS
ncbi:MAG: HAMP domain-containing protein [Anaerolineales bacterium]